jgi:formate dehydrogenase gamma subunit
MAETTMSTSLKTSKTYIRFNIWNRLEHIILFISFTTLALTGLPQKYASTQIGENMLRFFGGIETARQIHHIAAIILLAGSSYHFLAILYKVLVRRTSLNMVPLPEDFLHLFQDILYYLGLRKEKAYYGRYNYAEKAEYFAVVWGTLIMAITGFMMWNPIATTRFIPGAIIPASKAAHGWEAVLAVAAIILWHFYHVHLKHFNKSMFTGKLTEEEMKQEHPAELAMIESGKQPKEATPDVLRKRQVYFFPAAIALTLVFSFGIYKFTTLEKTAITTIPQEEMAKVFVPITPTPTLTPTPPVEEIPTPGAQGANNINSWDGSFGQLFRNRCGTCHGQTAVSGLSLGTYQGALKGGKRGPAIVPGDPQASVLVQIQSAGGHPGQLTAEELAKVVEWIKDGTPEK